LEVLQYPTAAKAGSRVLDFAQPYQEPGRGGEVQIELSYAMWLCGEIGESIVEGDGEQEGRFRKGQYES